MNETLIKYKINAGDKAWIMFGNKPRKVAVTAVIVELRSQNIYVKYRIERPNGGYDVYSEGEIFPTKDELLDSLR